MNALDKVKGLVTDEMVRRALAALIRSRGTYWGEQPIELDDIRAALEAAILPELEAMARDAGRLDALDAELKRGGPIVLHNGEGTGGMRGLGLSNTGRTLRAAIDQLCDLAAIDQKGGSDEA